MKLLFWFRKSGWDAAEQMVTGKYKNSVNANAKLNQISNTVLRLYDVLLTKYDYVSPELVKEYYLVMS